MAHSMTVLFLLLCSQLVVGGVVTSARGNTTLSCRNISAGDGYTYPVPSYIPSAVLWNKDCEQEWYNEEGEFLSDGRQQANKTEHPLVLNETIKNITVSECIDLHHSVTCHGSNEKFKHTYRVINDTISSQDVPKQQTDRTTTIVSVVIPIGLLLIGLLISVLICLHKKRRLRIGVWGKRLSGCCQQTDETKESDIPLEDITARNTEGEAQLNTSNTENMDPGDTSANGDVQTEEARPLQPYPYS